MLSTDYRPSATQHLSLPAGEVVQLSLKCWEEIWKDTSPFRGISSPRARPLVVASSVQLRLFRVGFDSFGRQQMSNVWNFSHPQFDFLFA